MKISIRMAAAAAVLLGAGAAHAAVTIVTRPAVNSRATGSFVTLPGPLNPGVYGVELRFGGAATWEVGVGRQTSVNGSFAQQNQAWGAAGTLVPFSLTWTASSLSITLGNVTTSFNSAVLLGDTLRVAAKRDASVSLATVDGFDFADTSVSGGIGTTNELLFWSPDAWGSNGLTATGTVRIGRAQGTGSSATEAFFTVGDYTPPIPEPATWMLMIAGFGLVGAAQRRAMRGRTVATS